MASFRQRKGQEMSSMKAMQFEVEINASRERVWSVLWQDETLREWAGLVDPGTYMVGELREGSTVQFISAEGYGVTSLVSKLIPNEYVLFEHQADTKDKGSDVRDDQWTGGKESYKVTDKGGITTLVMSFDVPDELEQVMRDSYPKALERIKTLSESS